LFGGEGTDGEGNNDLWEFQTQRYTWSQINATVKPPERLAHSLVIRQNENHTQLVTFGGRTGWNRDDERLLNDIWEIEI